jgi:hypothetical protein
MKHNEIKDLPKINSENMENIFNVYQDENGVYFYNLLQTITFPENFPYLNLFDSYTISSKDSWPLISYKTLNNTGLWWVICLVNNIINPVTPPIPGETLRIPIPALVREILNTVRAS